jgi:hypothetical protein
MSSDVVCEPTLLRKAAARTVDGPWSGIGRLVDLFTPQECANCFTATSYNAARTKTALAWPSSLPGEAQHIARLGRCRRLHAKLADDTHLPLDQS